MSTPDWVPILIYHEVVEHLPARDPFRNCVSAKVFDAQLRWLRERGYRSTTVERVASAIAGGERLPARPVVITFDDGYADNMRVAWPLLQRHGFGATVFVVTETIGGYNDFDRDHGMHRSRMLTAEEIRGLARAGAEVGSHTSTHPATLTALGDAALRDELCGSRRLLEAIVDRAVVTFSYPHSQVDDRVERAVGDAGYRAACAGVGTAFRPLRMCRVEPRAARGIGIQARLEWRRLKRLVRTVAA